MLDVFSKFQPVYKQHTVTVLMGCLQMETMLASHPGKEIDVMTEGEFFRAADEAIVTSCNRLESHLFRESAASVHRLSDGPAPDAVPIAKLSRILSIIHTCITGSYN